MLQVAEAKRYSAELMTHRSYEPAAASQAPNMWPMASGPEAQLPEAESRTGSYSHLLTRARLQRVPGLT